MECLFLTWFSTNVILSMKTRLLGPINLSQMWVGRGGEKSMSTKSGFRTYKTIANISGHLEFYLIFFSTKNHLLSWIPTKIDQILGTDLDWQRIWYSATRITSWQNSIMPKFGEGGAGLLKLKKFCLSEPIDRQFKVVWYIQKSAFKVN